MNHIQINLKCGKRVFILDDEDISKDQLSENLAELFSINSVAILNTNTTSLIIRPSDISSIKVDKPKIDINDDSDKPETEKITLPLEIAEDIITDVD